MELASGAVLGHYHILSSLGAGAMGEVYLARDTRLGRDVAIKVLPAEFADDEERLRRFEREAKTLASLNHPGIAQIFGIDQIDDTCFLVLELVPGETLEERLRRGPLALEEAVEVCSQIAEGLEAAHEAGVIHRDLKPANVRITPEGRVKLLDFGLAKPIRDAKTATDSGLSTEAGRLLGTPTYMAPEQARGKPIDKRVDVWSFGCVLYECLTAKRAFEGETLPDVLASVLGKEPDWTRLPASTPQHLRSLLSRCLSKDLRLRLRDVGDARLELERPVTETPLTSAPPGRASIAVLPFDNLSGDAEQEYFADGIVEEIITGLSRIKWLFVISRNSTFIYKGRPVDVRAVGRELGVRYVLQGSVRRSGNHVRLTGQLIETETAAHVWANRYDGTLGDIFTLQDELTMSVIGAVEPSLRRAEVERVRRKRPDNLDAYDLFLRALPLATTAMPEDADVALRYLEEAIRLEPSYAAVHGFIAWCHEQRYLRGGLHADTRHAALVHARAAIETGSDDALALAMGGFVVGILERNYETALEAIDRSLALSPSSALAFGFSSIIRVLKGEDSTAIEHARLGIRLSPYDPLVYLPYIGLAYAHLFAGDFAEAASAASRASTANPRFSVPRYLHAAALVGLDRLDEARAMADVVLALQPGFTISGLVSGNITTPERMEMLAEALHRAGLPE